MPLQTFINLKEERKQEILNVAFEEFALHEYKVASISNIVKKLNIAKGSIYRYFENKKDLYFYLIQVASEMRFSDIDNLFENPENDLFESITENFSRKIMFDMQNPLISGFLYNLIQEKNNEEIGNIQLQTKKRIVNLVITILQPYVKAGKIRKDINVFDLAYLITNIQWGMYDYLELKYNVDFRENVKLKKPVFTIPQEKIIDDVKTFVELMRNGIQNK
jgi:AcrR family transcriptional regulator